MKRLFITAAIAAVATSAQAADMAARRYTKAPVMIPAVSWTGCYLGVQAGGLWGHTNHFAANNPGFDGLPVIRADDNGFTGGGTIGCNYQVGQFVFGIENDISYANFNGSAANLPPFAATVINKTSTNWLDTLRGRAGFAVDRLFVYGTGGVAFSKISASAALAGFPTAEISQNRTGWVAGAGFEWAPFADPRWSVKAEYLYVDFGSKFYNLSAFFPVFLM